MVHGEAVGLKNGELMMGGILEGDCKDMGKCGDFELYSVVNEKPVEVTEWLTC